MKTENKLYLNFYIEEVDDDEEEKHSKSLNKR